MSDDGIERPPITAEPAAPPKLGVDEQLERVAAEAYERRARASAMGAVHFDSLLGEGPASPRILAYGARALALAVAIEAGGQRAANGLVLPPGEYEVVLELRTGAPLRVETDIEGKFALVGVPTGLARFTCTCDEPRRAATTSWAML